MAENTGAAATEPGKVESLRRYLGRNMTIQHVGVNVTDMEESKRFYSEILGGELVMELDGIKGDPWNSVLNGTALADGKKVPDLNNGDVLHVAFYSFGNVAVELLRYYNGETGKTFPGPVIGANEQGPAGMHLCFNLSADENATEFLAALRLACADMPKVRINKPELLVLPTSGGPADGWCLAFVSGPNDERIEFVQLSDDAPVVETFNTAALKYRAKLLASQSENAVDHIVLMALKSDVNAEQEEEATKAINDLQTQPGILSFSFGKSLCPQRSGAYTHALVIRHASSAAAAAYQAHPQHVKVRDEILGPLINRDISVIAFDIEVHGNACKL